MSRSATAGELAVLARKEREVGHRIKVQNGSGTMIDYSAWLDSGKIERDVDQPVDGCTLSFVRSKSNQSLVQSLSPLRTDSVINRLDNGITYAPALDLNRIVTVEIPTTAIGAPVLETDYKLLFKGTIDVVNFEKNPVVITCRDLGAPLVDRWIETETTFGTGVAGSGVGGRSIQLVMQDILDAVFGAGVYPLYTPVSPGADLNTYQQQRMSVMDALQDLAQQIGWDVRFRWDDGTSAFRLTLSEPPRAKTTPDYTFGPNAYHDITELSLDITDIRNVITGSFRDANDLGIRATVTVSDATSISKYGRRFMLIQEADISPIDSSPEMTTMLNSALADLKEPKANQSVNMPLHWPADLWDLYRYSPNSVHYDSNQDIAVVELAHEFAPNYHRTTATVRGTPIGQYSTWHGRGAGPIGGGGGGAPGTAVPPTALITPRNGETDETVRKLRFDVIPGAGGGGTNISFIIYEKIGFAAETTLFSGAGAFPRDYDIGRDARHTSVIRFKITDAATTLTDTATTVVPPQRPEVTSAGNVKRGRAMDDGKYGAASSTNDGHSLDPAVQQSLAGTNRAVMKGYQSGYVKDGSAVTFSPVYQNSPAIRLTGGKAANATYPYDDIAPSAATASGFTCHARNRNKGTVTARTAQFTSPLTTTSEGGTVGPATLANAPSNDSNYKARMAITVSCVTPAEEPIGSVTVVAAVEVSVDGSSGWTEYATISKAVSRFTAGTTTTTYSAQERTVNVASLTSSSKIRLKLKSITYSGGASDTTQTLEGYNNDPGSEGHGVEYSTSSGATDESKTPDSDDFMFWEAQEVVS